jgi:hypothetical protein
MRSNNPSKQTPKKSSPRWIGMAFMVIGVIHSAVGFWLLRDTVAELVQEGLFNTVHGQPMREAAFWFLFFGFLVIILGAVLDFSESQGFPLPRFLSWFTLVFIGSAVFIMPVSGFWLVLVPMFGLFRYHTFGNVSGN